MEKLLIVDDDKGIQKQLKWSLSDYDVVLADDRESAVAAVRRHEPKVVTLDLGLPPDETNASEGLAALQEILAIAPHTKVIVITGNDDRTNALTAIAAGAYDFYQKPVDTEVINVIVSRAYSVAAIEEENRKMRAVAGSDIGIIGNSESIERLRMMVKRIAPTGITALLLGESGTGKEVTANAVHLASDRKNKPFIAINCASIPETLLESELFGFEKGAFTGAHRTTKGKIECAEGGTLFLDEIGDMPYSLQAKLLRFLQEKRIERLGGRQEIPVNVRVVCATNQNLEEMVAEKTFREDLFYRLNVIPLNLPPLREREQDSYIIARHFLAKYNKQQQKNFADFSKDARDFIIAYPWPGNVRQLENTVHSVCIMNTGKEITLTMIQPLLAEQLKINEPVINTLAQPSFQPAEATQFSATNNDEIIPLELVEKNAIEHAIAKCDGNITKAAALLEVNPSTIYRKMQKWS